MTQITNTLVHW